MKLELKTLEQHIRESAARTLRRDIHDAFVAFFNSLHVKNVSNHPPEFQDNLHSLEQQFYDLNVEFAQELAVRHAAQKLLEQCSVD